jgi:dUTP pyrophosphatase
MCQLPSIPLWEVLTLIKIKKLHAHARLPEKAHAGDLGYDLFAAEEMTIFSDETMVISTGVAIQFPEGYGGFIKDRSSVSTKYSVFTVAGVIDNGYIGEIKVAMHNAGEDPWYCNPGDKIAQLVLIPIVNFGVEEADELIAQDQRGVGGFGSTNSDIPYSHDSYR